MWGTSWTSQCNPALPKRRHERNNQHSCRRERCGHWSLIWTTFRWTRSVSGHRLWTLHCHKEWFCYILKTVGWLLSEIFNFLLSSYIKNKQLNSFLNRLQLDIQHSSSERNCFTQLLSWIKDIPWWFELTPPHWKQKLFILWWKHYSDDAE